MEIHHSSWNKKLSETNNIVNIEILCDGLTRRFDVKFKNIKSNNTWSSQWGFNKPNNTWSSQSGFNKPNNNQSSYGKPNNSQSDTKILIKDAKLKLENTLIDGSTLNPDDWIGLNPNKDEIIRLIKTEINNKDISVIISSSWSKKLSETNNTVNIEISCNLLKERFDVKFKNVKSSSEKLFKEIREKLTTSLIDGSTLDSNILIGLNPNKNEIIRLIKKHY